MLVAINSLYVLIVSQKVRLFAIKVAMRLQHKVLPLFGMVVLLHGQLVVWHLVLLTDVEQESLQRENHVRRYVAHVCTRLRIGGYRRVVVQAVGERQIIVVVHDEQQQLVFGEAGAVDEVASRMLWCWAPTFSFRRRRRLSMRRLVDD